VPIWSRVACSCDFSHEALQNQAAGGQDADVLRLQNQQQLQEINQLKVCCAPACRPMCFHLVIYPLVQAAADAEAQRVEAEIQRLREEIQRLMLVAPLSSAASSATS
jgi:hypothetical protein